MTFHLERRATAQPFHFTSPDPYWRKAASYAQALQALFLDATDNYIGGATGPRPERGMLTGLFHAAVCNVSDLMIPFVARNLFTEERAPHEGMFVMAPCYPYAARHYANIVEDLRDYAVSCLSEPSPENVSAYGSLPALLTELANNLNALTQFERRPTYYGESMQKAINEQVQRQRRVALFGDKS